MNDKPDTSILSVVKMGRLTDGFQKDHGVVRHAMMEESYCWGTHSKALCGSKPGRRSVGFVNDPDITDITCKPCLKKIEKLNHGR